MNKKCNFTLKDSELNNTYAINTMYFESLSKLFIENV